MDSGIKYKLKMVGEWEAMVNTARMRRQAQEIAEKEKERGIQTLERLEWGRYLREEFL